MLLGGGRRAQGLEELIVRSAADIYALLDRGSAKRRTAETLLNKQSSRSHSVFCVTARAPALGAALCPGGTPSCCMRTGGMRACPRRTDRAHPQLCFTARVGRCATPPPSSTRACRPPADDVMSATGGAKHSPAPA